MSTGPRSGRKVRIYVADRGNAKIKLTDEEDGKMRRKIAVLTMTAISVCSLFGCSTAPKSLPDEAYSPVAYKLYPAPEDAYVGDTMPFVTEDGYLELYYLYDTDHNGQGYHPIYSYSTKNLYDYEDRGMALEFGLLSDPDPAIGTGSVMQDQNGLYHLFYTGHNDTGNGGKGKECVMHATSSDRKSWEKHPEDTFYSPDNFSKDDFRDPEVFWMEDDNCYWMLVAARENTLGGVIAKYTSEDLKSWEYEGPLYAPMAQYMLECPDLFKINDTWYITYSWDCVTYYAAGESANGPFTAPADNILDGKGTISGNGFVFYAAKTAHFMDKDYLCGWIGRAGLMSDSGIYQWAGNMVNHQLVANEDGTLGVKAPDSFAEYFTAEKKFQAVKKDGTVKIKDGSITLSAKDSAYALADMGTRAPSMMLECDVTLDADGCAGFAFGGSEQDETYTALCLDAKQNKLHYEGLELTEVADNDPVAFTAYDFSEKKTHHVTLVCENEIVITYIDDRKALSSRIMHSTDGAHIGVFADGCNAAFENITIKLPKS